MSDTGILHCTTSQLNLDIVLVNGQSFRWKKVNSKCWLGTAYHRLWKLWRINDDSIAFEMLHNFQKEKNDEWSSIEILKNYFQLDVDLEKLYQLWMSKCIYFKQLYAENKQTLKGIRILKQPPVETLFAFICSSNNNIPRISKMVEKLCELYGTKAEVKLDLCTTEVFYDFPTIQQLIDNVSGMEIILRKAGFGYRAASITKTVQTFACEKSFIHAYGAGDTWLDMLKQCPYEEARNHLMQLPGIGPKVADCICLMALCKNHVVPVDRHVFSLTSEIYKPKFLNNKKGLTNRIGKQIGEFYAELFGNYAGWTHSILFSTRLKLFQKLL